MSTDVSPEVENLDTLYELIKTKVNEGLRPAEAFRIVAGETGRGVGSLSTMYYRRARKDPEATLDPSRGRPRKHAAPWVERAQSAHGQQSLSAEATAPPAPAAPATPGPARRSRTRAAAGAAGGRKARTAPARRPPAAPAEAGGDSLSGMLREMADRFAALEAENARLQGDNEALRARLERVEVALRG